MRRAGLSVCVLLMAAPLLALDAYPKTSVAEDATATWCSYCPNAYAGLDVVHSYFDYGQFLSVRYYATTGAYGTPETDARIAFYNVTGFPTVIIDGIHRHVGAGSTTASTGEPYLSNIQNTTLEPAPVRVTIDSFDPSGGSIGVTVTMHSTTYILDNDTLVFVLLEDDVATGHTHVARDLVYENISLAGAGNTAVVTTSFIIDPSWVTANLNAMVMVQQADDKAIVQSASTYPQPSFSIRGMVPFSRIAFGPSAGTFVTDNFTLQNVGQTDTFTAEVVIDSAPPGWQTELVDETGSSHTTPYVFGLAGGASTYFHVKVLPASTGQMEFRVQVTSPNLAQPLSIPFTYFTDDLDAMVVDDDGGDPYEDYFTAALDAAGFSYGVWDRSVSPLTAEVAQNCSLLVWNVGWAFPTVDDDDKIFLNQYLDDGKALFISGQDIGWELNNTGGSPDPTWYQTRLHAIYVRDDTNIMDLNGVPGDPITDGLTLYIAGGTGANNQQYPDEIAPADADTTAILNYVGDGCGAIRSVDSVTGAKVVYLGFGFEGIDNADDRRELLASAVNWLLDIVFRDDFEDGTTGAWSLVAP